jgi:isoquinoline 1-oxidoreductase subunit beta
MKTRRFVLGSLGAAGALVLGWGLLPPRQRLSTAQPLATLPGELALTGWLKLGADNSVVVVMPKSEMGQGTHTGLAMLLADEMDADWSQVRIEHGPIDKIYNNLASVVDGLPFHPDNDGSVKQLAGWLTAKTMREIGPMMTGGSSSIKDLWLPMRQAGASARAMLVGAAAQAWQVPAMEVMVADGVLSHASGKRATFGEMAARAAQQALAERAPLKTPAQWKLIGKPLPRLEAAAKLTGKASAGTTGYALDVVPAGLLYASVVMCPTLGGQVANFDGAAASAMRGVKKVSRVPGLHGGTAGVAVIADNPWRAMQAAKLVKVTWDETVPAAAFSSAAAMNELAQTLDKEAGFAYFKTGDVDGALKAAAKSLSAEYSAPYLAHATLEPQNCTVQFKDGRATVWAPTQVPERARAAVATVLGIAEEAVDVQVQFLGGGFGRRLDIDFIAQAAAIAKEAGGAPVQTMWTRSEDMQHDFYRPAAVSRFKAGLDAQGKLTAWHNSSAGQAIVPQALTRLYGLPAGLTSSGPDKTTSEGAFDQPYEWPHARIGHVIVDLPVQVGFWRSVGHSHQAFFKESFVDEAAHAAGLNPLDFRALLLQKHPRHLKVLQSVAKLSGWGTPLGNTADGAKMARGIALHHSFGSVVAQVAEVSVAPDKTIRVHRVFCSIDCGTVVNPNLVAQQLESAIVFGLSAALYGQITIDKGRVQQSNFHDYPLLRFADCPAIVSEVLPSPLPPEGVGEPGTPPIAPAVANALFALTGQRLRSLPLKLV